MIGAKQQFTRRALVNASWTKAYLIGVPLTLAIAAGGIVLGARLSRNPFFANDNSPWLQALVDAGVFLLTAFFLGVQRLGLLAALGVAAVLVLAILLICGRVVGTLLITAISGRQSGEVEVTDEDMQAFLSR